MPRRPKGESVTRGINMSLLLVSQFELLEHDPMTGRVKYGAWPELVEHALSDYIELRKHGVSREMAKRSKLSLIRELETLRKQQAEVPTS